MVKKQNNNNTSSPPSYIIINNNRDEQDGFVARAGKCNTTYGEYLDHNIMDKILNRGEEINEPLLQDEDKDNIDSLATTYDKNSLFVKNRQGKLLEDKNKDKNKDLIPNEWQNKRNLESKEEMDELRLQILNLTIFSSDILSKYFASARSEFPCATINTRFPDKI